jgi:hypothetical protein
MAFIGRLFAILFGFVAACFVAGIVIVFALLFPEMTDLSMEPMNQDTINIILGFGFILVSGFALLPAMIAVVITEAFYIRSILAYAVAGGLAGLCCYLGFIPFDTVTWSFDGIVRRHLEVMVGAGILGGVIYWMIAGRNAGAWRDAGRDPRASTPTR